MYTNTYELETWADGHRELVAQDVQRAQEEQAMLMQRLSQMMIAFGQQVATLGQRLQGQGDTMQLQS